MENQQMVLKYSNRTAIHWMPLNTYDHYVWDTVLEKMAAKNNQCTIFSFKYTLSFICLLSAIFAYYLQAL